MFRLLKERPRGILSMLETRINRTALEPGILAMTIHTGFPGNKSDDFKQTGYENKKGESVCDLVISFPSYNNCRIPRLIR